MEFNKYGTLDIPMFKYLDNVIRDFPEVISRWATTLVADYLFNIRDKTKVQALEEQRALISPHGGSAAFHVEQSKEWHPDSGGIPDH